MPAVIGDGVAVALAVGGSRDSGGVSVWAFLTRSAAMSKTLMTVELVGVVLTLLMVFPATGGAALSLGTRCDGSRPCVY